MKIMLVKRLLMVFLLLPVFIFSGESYATNCTIPGPVLTMPASLSVDDNAPVPSLIGSWQSAVMNINCWKDSIYEWNVFHRLYTTLSPTGITVSDGGLSYQVFATGQPGVGVAIGFYNENSLGWESLTSAPANNSFSVGSNQIRNFLMHDNYSGGYYNTSAKFRVAFVKTATVRASFNTGGLTVVNYYPVWYYRNSAGSGWGLDGSHLVYSNIQVSAVQFNVTPPSCAVATGSSQQDVKLRAVRKTDFKGVGTSIAPVNFRVDLINCKKLPLVTMTISGAADSDFPSAAAKGVLKVSSDTATGTGIQIMNNVSGTPVPYSLNSPVYLGTVTGSGTNDTFSVPLVAQYIQTKSAVAAGRVQASVTMMLSYQ
jgi:major type 1 subunit fimbrin (pilin)